MNSLPPTPLVPTIPNHRVGLSPRAMVRNSRMEGKGYNAGMEGEDILSFSAYSFVFNDSENIFEDSKFFAFVLLLGEEGISFESIEPPLAIISLAF